MKRRTKKLRTEDSGFLSDDQIWQLACAASDGDWKDSYGNIFTGSGALNRIQQHIKAIRDFAYEEGKEYADQFPIITHDAGGHWIPEEMRRRVGFGVNMKIETKKV